MEWQEAKDTIDGAIERNTDLNTARSANRSVKHKYPWGFQVAFGRGKASRLTVTWDMLQDCWDEAVSNNNGIYDCTVFERLYPTERKNRGCYVHIIGKILELSGLAELCGNKYYLRERAALPVGVPV